MNKTFTIKSLLTVSIFLIICSACLKNEDFEDGNNFQVTPEFSLPLGSYTFSINEYLYSLQQLPAAIDSLLFNNDTLPNLQLVYETGYPQELNLSSISEQFDSIKLLSLRLFIINNYPTPFEANFYLLNANNDTIWNFAAGTIEGAELNNQGDVIKPTEYLLDVVLPDNISQNLHTVAAFTFNYAMNTTLSNFEMVKYYESQNIQLFMGIRVEIEINSDNL